MEVCTEPGMPGVKRFVRSQSPSGPVGRVGWVERSEGVEQDGIVDGDKQARDGITYMVVAGCFVGSSSVRVDST